MIKQEGQGGKLALSEHVSVSMVAKGILASYIITIPIFIIFALVLTYTSFPEKYISPVVVLTTIISVTTAGTVSTRNVRSKGWLNGSVVGFIYMLVLYILSGIIFSDFTISRYVLIMALIGIFAGSIGGIIGINMKRKSHSGRHR